jgi:hypothetical protein
MSFRTSSAYRENLNGSLDIRSLCTTQRMSFNLSGGGVVSIYPEHEKLELISGALVLNVEPLRSSRPGDREHHHRLLA